MSAEDYEDDEYGCGWEYDHDLDEGSHGDGVTVYICRTCGAEIWEDEESE